MKRIIILISIVCFISMTVWAENPVFQTDDKESAEKGELFDSDNNEAEEEYPEGSKEANPPCCMELGFLNPSMNTVKDNICLGMIAGSPIGATIVISFVALIIFLIIMVIELIFSLGQSTVMADSFERIAVPGFFTVLGISVFASIAMNLLTPYYDYEDKETHKPLSNPSVLLQRAGGCLISTGIGVLIVFLIAQNLGDNN
ncbi:MAG: hypothetical protein R6U31_04750 [bacterium]